MIRKWFDRLLAPWRTVAAPLAAPVNPERRAMRVNPEALAMMRNAGTGKLAQPFEFPKVAPGVMPSKTKIAVDAALTDTYSYASLQSALSEGVAFIGFPELSALTQRAEYRRPAEILAKEMTRKWIKFQAAGEDDKTDKIAAIEAEFKRLGVQAAFCAATEQDGFFGRSQIYLDTGDGDLPEELKTPLAENATKVTIGKLKALRVIEPIWTYPNQYNADNPLAGDYFKPQTWFVMGKEVHDTRMLTFVSRQLPDLLKPAYAFAGISLTQILIPYVNNWLRTRQSVSDVLRSFSVFVLKTDMSSLLNAGAGVAEQARFELFNSVRDNMGLLALNKDTEEFQNVSVPLGSLDHLQAQSQEHMASVCGIPLVILLGITPSGLNASSSADLEVFYSWVASQQTHLYTKPLDRLLNIVQLSLFGEIDPCISYRFEPLRALDEGQVIAARQAEAETDAVYIDRGVITPGEARARVTNQSASAYHGLDLNVVPDAPADDTDPMLDDDEKQE